ncbi:MAG: recombinase family protein [Gammaproteobacteria bacterium]
MTHRDDPSAYEFAAISRPRAEHRQHRRRRAQARHGPSRAILYSRVSTSDQANNGGSLAGQIDSLRRLAAEKGWAVVAELADDRSGKDLDRQGITSALAGLMAREADLLAVTKLDRLSRSVQDFASLVERSRAEGWRLYIADIQFDGTNPAGELVANMLSALSQWERRMIATRTSEGIAALKAQGRYRGIKVSPVIRDRIVSMRSSGATYQAVADSLNAEGVMSPGGVTWGPKTVWGIARGAYRSVDGGR